MFELFVHHILVLRLVVYLIELLRKVIVIDTKRLIDCAAVLIELLCFVVPLDFCEIPFHQADGFGALIFADFASNMLLAHDLVIGTFGYSPYNLHHIQLGHVKLSYQGGCAPILGASELIEPYSLSKDE